MGTTGALRVYLGAAPGVGKSFRMLEEGHRRRDRGTDVVIGLVETHGRLKTAALIGALEVVPRLIGNLLDLSRLQAGALAIHRQPVVLDELVPITLDAVGPETAAVHWQPAAG